jgi:hypothetical protein
VLPEISGDLASWIAAQPMFFVGTAPSGDDGHVNVSPKGDMRTFAVLGPRRVAYVDLFGSGIETVSHLKQNGRIVLMLCAFRGRPKVLRLHGRGRVVEMHDPEFDRLLGSFELTAEVLPSVRAIIDVDVQRISDSCGFVVPLMAATGERGVLYKTAEVWMRKRGESAIRDYCDVNNAESVDGLPGLTPFGDEVTEAQRKVHASDGRRL